MTVGYLVGTLSAQPAGAGFYEQSEVMRRWCGHVQEWTGITMPEILTVDFSSKLMPGMGDAPRQPADLSVRQDWMYHSEVRQAAHALGLADVLADQGIYPELLLGSSIGGMIVACLAGCMTRREFFAMLTYMAGLPLAPPGEPARGIAYAMLPAKADLSQYCGARRPNVYPISDSDMGTYRVVMFSGYLKELEELAADAPPGQVQGIMSGMGGMHTPLEEFIRARLESYIANEIDFRDPRVNLLSAVKGTRLETAEAVRQDLLDSITMPTTSLPDLVGSLEEHGAELVLALGTGLPAVPLRTNVPVLQAAVPADMDQIMTTMYNLGIELKDEPEQGPATIGNWG